mmetsp:Transcript_421/g.1035  ORF Transcript_421/g.1035 Transcript_421/m.1035 type:complete len:553 (-) Transcript_421:114-1772(-)
MGGREVSFAVNCADTRLGFHVRVVGSCIALGKWVPTAGLPLQTSAGDFPTWRSTKPAALDEDEVIEYKYVVCDNDGRAVRWEDTPNRHIHLAASAQRGELPERGWINVFEAFNTFHDPSEHRFQAVGSTSGARRLSSSRSLKTRVSGQGSELFKDTPETGDADGADLFAPTIRERLPSMSVLSEHSQVFRSDSRAFSKSLFAAMGGPDGVTNGDPEPEVKEADGGRPEETGLADTEGGLVREESCSNLFASSGDSDEIVKESSEFEDKYSLVGQGPLGEGTFGLVWRCVPKRAAIDGEPVKERAAKIVRKARLQPRDMRYLLGEDGEVKTHVTMKHPHIVTLFEYFDEPHTVTLVLEYCSGGDLFDAIVRNSKVSGRGFSEKAASIVTRHVLSALVYVHSQKVVHRDIKCENVLLSCVDVPVEQNVFKLCDFGFAAHDRGEGLCDRLGSPDTVAPEVVVGTRYSTPADLWSTGVLIYMMLSATPPFYATSDCEVLRKVRTGSYSLSGDLWDAVSLGPKNLITSLMVVDAKLRPSAEQALNSEWLKLDPETTA